MTPQEELRMAWALWHLLSQLTDTLWEKYEDGFIQFCTELNRHDIWRFGRDNDDDAADPSM
jgi:hypothetical protein